MVVGSEPCKFAIISKLKLFWTLCVRANSLFCTCKNKHVLSGAISFLSLGYIWPRFSNCQQKKIDRKIFVSSENKKDKIENKNVFVRETLNSISIQRAFVPNVQRKLSLLTIEKQENCN